MCRAWIALLVILIFGLMSSYHPAPRGREHREQYERHSDGGTPDCTNNCAASDGSTPAPQLPVSPLTNGNEPPPAGESDQSAPQNRWSLNDPNTTIAVFTVILAFVGGSQVRVGYLQRRVYTAQTEISKAQNQAFVYLEPLKVRPMATGDDEVTVEWMVHISFKNSGTTPATRLIVDVRRAVLSTAELHSFSFVPDYSRSQKLFLGPQASAEIYGPTFGVRNIEDTFGQNKTHILVWGWAEYEDVFSTARHRTEFCFELTGEYVADLDRPSASHHVPYFVMHPRHNGADDECMHQARSYQA